MAAATPTVAKPRAPMFSFSLALISGILLAHFLWRPPLWIGVAATVSAVGAALVVSHRPRLAWLIAHVGVVCLGWVAMVGQAGQQAEEGDFALLAPFLNGQPVVITSRVVRVPGVLARVGDHQQIDVETESLDDGSQRHDLTAGLRLNLYGRAEEVEYGDEAAIAGVPHLRYGDQVRFTAKLREPKSFRNPGAWDYAGYLRRIGIVALGSAKASSVEVLSTQSPDRIGRLRYTAREAVIRRIHEVWPAAQDRKSVV